MPKTVRIPFSTEKESEEVREVREKNIRLHKYRSECLRRGRKAARTKRIKKYFAQQEELKRLGTPIA